MVKKEDDLACYSVMDIVVQKTAMDFRLRQNKMTLNIFTLYLPLHSI